MEMFPQQMTHTLGKLDPHLSHQTNIEAVTLKKAQQSTNRVSFGPEYVRHIPPRSKKY